MHPLHTRPIPPYLILEEWTGKNLRVLLLKAEHRHDFPDFFSAQCTFLYNHPDHLFLQSNEPIYTFLIQLAGIEAAWIHFRKASHTLISPIRAPFGGIEGYKNIRGECFHFLLNCMHKSFRTLEVEHIQISLPPACYSGNTDQEDQFQESGFLIGKRNLNLHIMVDQVPLHEKISKNQVRRLNKCQHAGFTAGEIPVSHQLYTFLAHCRYAKNHTLSMSEAQLISLKQTFPDQVRAFGVYDRQQLICASVVVSVNQHIMYCFLPASLPAYNPYSPMVMLYHTLYQYCKETGITVLDLGISCDENGAEKPSLQKFKIQMGGIPLSKSTVTANGNSVHQALTSS